MAAPPLAMPLSRAALTATALPLAALVLAAVALASGPARAQDDPLTGKDAFLRHCAVCHGLEGYGNGPLAGAMKIAPTDLTRLATTHDGTFPAAKIADVIRNGGAVLGHGSTAMPAWGTYFAERGKPQVARDRIKALVSYLESIQKN